MNLSGIGQVIERSDGERAEERPFRQTSSRSVFLRDSYRQQVELALQIGQQKLRTGAAGQVRIECGRAGPWLLLSSVVVAFNWWICSSTLSSLAAASRLSYQSRSICSTKPIKSVIWPASATGKPMVHSSWRPVVIDQPNRTQPHTKPVVPSDNAVHVKRPDTKRRLPVGLCCSPGRLAAAIC